VLFILSSSNSPSWGGLIGSFRFGTFSSLFALTFWGSTEVVTTFDLSSGFVNKFFPLSVFPKGLTLSTVFFSNSGWFCFISSFDIVSTFLVTLSSVLVNPANNDVVDLLASPGFMVNGFVAICLGSSGFGSLLAFFVGFSILLFTTMLIYKIMIHPKLIWLPNSLVSLFVPEFANNDVLPWLLFWNNVPVPVVFVLVTFCVVVSLLVLKIFWALFPPNELDKLDRFVVDLSFSFSVCKLAACVVADNIDKIVI